MYDDGRFTISGYDSFYFLFLFIGMIVFMKISSKLMMMAFHNFQVIVLFMKIGIKFQYFYGVGLIFLCNCF